MIAYAVQANQPKYLDEFRRYCKPGLKRIMRRGDKFRLLRDPDSIHLAYNEAIRWARGLDNLEALVLLHADAEVLDEHFPTRLRNLLEDKPKAAVVGACGARPAFGLEWWTRPCFGGVFHADGEVFKFHSTGNHEVDIVDGVVLCLSPWAVREVWFDPGSYIRSPWYAYDGDICYEARSRGRQVWVMDTRVRHHTSGGVDTKTFALAEASFLEKWATRGVWG